MKWAPWVESLTIHIFKPAGIGAARVPFPQDAKIIAVQETTLMTCPPLGGSSGSLDLSGKGGAPQGCHGGDCRAKTEPKHEAR